MVIYFAWKEPTMLQQSVSVTWMFRLCLLAFKIIVDFVIAPYQL